MLNFCKNLEVELWRIFKWGFPNSSVGKESTCNAGDSGSIHGSGRPLKKG